MKNNKPVSAIYITPNRIRFASTVLGPDKKPVVKEQEIKGSLKNFLTENKIIPGYIISCVPRAEVSVKYISFPTLNESELRQMVEFELNNLMPLKPEELVYDYAVIRKGPGEHSHLMVVVAPRDTILKHASFLKEAGLIPDEVTISAIALFKEFALKKYLEANYLLINMDDNFMDVVYISGGKLDFSRALTLSSVGEIPNAVKEIELTAKVLRDKEYKIDKVILCGGADLKAMAEAVAKVLPYEIQIDDTLSVIKGALLKEPGDYPRINLLPQELRLQKKAWMRRKVLVYMGVVLALNLSLFANIAFLKTKAKQGYLALLKSEVTKIDSQASGLQKKLANVRILRGYLNSNRLTLALLAELYRAAPAGVSFSSLDIYNREAQGVMMVLGQARDSDMALAFVSSLKEAAFIKSAEVVRITKKSRAAGENTVDFEVKSYFSGYK
jgi:Tfp pilus assembly protein PilN